MATPIDIPKSKGSNGNRRYLRINSDFGKTFPKKTLCLVALSDLRVLSIEVDHKSNGDECLQKVCKLLGISEEADYFGLQYKCNKGEMHWINNRNRLSKQLIGLQTPYPLQFRVKYYVPYENLQLNDTRLQFYSNVYRNLKDGTWDNGIPLETQARYAAMMCHVDFGDFNLTTSPCKYPSYWPTSRGTMPLDFMQMVAKAHTELIGISAHLVQQKLAMEACHWPMYGTMYHNVRTIEQQRILLGVSPRFIFLCDLDKTVFAKYSLDKVLQVRNSNNTLCLMFSDFEIGFGLPSTRCASTLSRCITETYTFFLCSTVLPDIQNQLQKCSHLHKPKLSALILHHGSGRHDNDSNVENGTSSQIHIPSHKEYSFDVLRSSREVLDRARRGLHRHANFISSSNDSCCSSINNSTSPHAHVPLSTTSYQVTRTDRSFSDVGSCYDFSKSMSCNTSPVFPLCNNTNNVFSIEHDYINDDCDCSCNSVSNIACSTMVLRQLSSSPIAEEKTSCGDFSPPAESLDIVDLRDRLERLEESYLCRLCMDSHISHVFLPCSHMACCGTCAGKLTHCPLCRSSIEQRYRAFLPCPVNLTTSPSNANINLGGLALQQKNDNGSTFTLTTPNMSYEYDKFDHNTEHNNNQQRIRRFMSSPNATLCFTASSAVPSSPSNVCVGQDSVDDIIISSVEELS